MDAVRKIVFFTVGMILTVSFIAVGMGIFNRAGDSVKETEKELTRVYGSLENIRYSVYETGKSVSGSEVLRLIYDLPENMVITVKNGAYQNSYPNEEGVVYVKGSGKICGYGKEAEGTKITLEEAKRLSKDSKSNMYYINPSALFLCERKTDSNGNLGGFSFTQRGIGQ